MSSSEDVIAAWLPVIGKSLARLCLQEALRAEPESLNTVLKRVGFLEGLGLSRGDAAEAAGTSAASVRELHRQSKVRKSGNGKSRKQRTR